MEQTVLVGVTGGIAAYKSCQLVRLLQKAGLRVKVVMTPHATEFVGPTTFRSLTKEPVALGLFDEPGDPVHHVSLAQECDLFVIAPCTANVLAKMACGIADDLLTTTALAFTKPVLVAPAMNTAMYDAPATQENLATLAKRGVRIVEADTGYLACGDTGKGRMAEPEQIAEQVLAVLRGGALQGKRVMVTAGPTEEPLDPVRVLTNRSSGKMGYALAREAAAMGAQVTLVSGPVALQPPAGVETVHVRTACQMLEAAEAAFADADIAVFTAAVADMRPAQCAAQKLKKGADDEALRTIALVENPDILKTLAARKAPGQVVVGFAAETQDVVANAQKKLAAKGADMMVANQVGDNLVFGQDESTASLVTAEGVEDLPTMGKGQLARRILEAAATRL